MAKSSKVISKSKAVSKKAPAAEKPVKKIAANKTATKKIKSKSDVIKKAVVKKSANKKAVLKKSVEKKQPVISVKKKSALRRSSPAEVVTKGLTGDAKKGTGGKQLKNKKPVGDPGISAKSATAKISTGKPETKKIESKKNALKTSGNSINQSQSIDPDTHESLQATNNTIPAPVQKYAKPADPFHGKTTPVKGKSNISPSGKKPLWNK